MRFAKARLLIAVGLLFAWLGYIAYQALAVGRFPVVSHAQLLVSTLDVIAEVGAGEDGRPLAKAQVTEVHWPASQKRLGGQEIEVTNLPGATGFEGPGLYILPLVRGEGGAYRVAGLPRSPGFDRFQPLYLIYPVTALTRKQLDAIPKPTPGPHSTDVVQ
jgi:hypothetical protein